MTGPTTQSAEPDPQGVLLRKNLGMEDLGVPTAPTINNVTWTGGTVVNRTNVVVKVTSMPTMYGLDVGGARLIEARAGYREVVVAPGATITWTGYGTGLFARASLVAFMAVPDASVWWNTYPDGTGCLGQPMVTY